jgi:Sushi repeat (SCR repeat)
MQLHLCILPDRQCGYPPVPLNGDVPLNGFYIHYEENVKRLYAALTYECQEGYELIGNATNLCDFETGKFSWGQPPQCHMAKWYDYSIKTEKRITGMLLVFTHSFIFISIFVLQRSTTARWRRCPMCTAFSPPLHSLASSFL